MTTPSSPILSPVDGIRDSQVLMAANECANYCRSTDEFLDMIERMLHNGINSRPQIEAWFQGTCHIYCAACLATMDEAQIQAEIDTTLKELQHLS